jgi:predicted Zn-dependent protease
MATLEQIIDEARALSPAEKRRLRQALDRELEQPAPAQSAKPAYPTNEQERAWVEAHRDEYLGQWVALDGDHLVAHGTNARTVYEAARAQGVEIPYIDRVEKKVEAFMGEV